MLTGKCKEDFEKWYKSDKIEGVQLKYNLYMNGFYGLHFSMQYGVYVDFFDSFDIYITEIPNWKKSVKSFRIGFHFIKENCIYSQFIRPEEKSPFFVEFNSRDEARVKAIEKVNEIYNQTK